MKENPTIVISGALGGVGREVADRLASDGYSIVALYRSTPRAEAESVVGLLRGEGHIAVHCDLCDETDVADMLSMVVDRFRNIYGCVHAAVSPILRKNILECDPGGFREQFETGLFGGFNLLRAVVPIMIESKKGKVVGILSRPLQVESASYSKMAGYMVAKYGLWGLLKELHLRVASAGIAVNAVAPDFLDTPLHSDLPVDVRKFIAERAVSGSLRSPQDVAQAVSYLFSDKGGFLQGKMFSFDPSEIKSL